MKKMDGQIHDDPAVTVPSPEAGPPAKEMEFLGFILAGEEYVIDIMTIQEITRAVEVTRIPRMPDYMSGIITLRGTIIPIFDLRKRLNLTRESQGGDPRFIVASFEGSCAGIVVDRVTDVVRIKIDELEPPPFNVSGREGQFLKGIGYYMGRMLILLDYEKVLAVEGFGEAAAGTA